MNQKRILLLSVSAGAGHMRAAEAICAYAELPEFNTAYITLTWEELRQYGSQTGDTEGLVNYGLSIKGIKMAVLMYDRKEEIKLSFRSLSDFDVNALARKHFSGGGHKNASGGQSKLSLEETLKKFLSILPEYKQELNR